MRSRFERFLLVLVLFLGAALAAPFFIEGREGEPLLSRADLSTVRLPGLGLRLPGLRTPSPHPFHEAPEEPAATTSGAMVYSWLTPDGSWAFSDRPPTEVERTDDPLIAWRWREADGTLHFADRVPEGIQAERIEVYPADMAHREVPETSAITPVKNGPSAGSPPATSGTSSPAVSASGVIGRLIAQGQAVIRSTAAAYSKAPELAEQAGEARDRMETRNGELVQTLDTF